MKQATRKKTGTVRRTFAKIATTAVLVGSLSACASSIQHKAIEGTSYASFTKKTKQEKLAMNSDSIAVEKTEPEVEMSMFSVTASAGDTVYGKMLAYESNFIGLVRLKVKEVESDAVVFNLVFMFKGHMHNSDFRMYENGQIDGDSIAIEFFGGDKFSVKINEDSAEILFIPTIDRGVEMFFTTPECPMLRGRYAVCT